MLGGKFPPDASGLRVRIGRIDVQTFQGEAVMEVDKVIRDFIVENFLFGKEDPPLGDEDSFLQKGFIDSTGILEVVSFIEERFGIKVEDDDLLPENLDSIRRLVNFILRKQGSMV